MTAPTKITDWPQDWQEAAERGQCLHCGNPLGRFWRQTDGPFCCRGCANVYRLIHEGNLERYYELTPDNSAPAANLRPESFAWLDRLLAEHEAEHEAERETAAAGSTGPWHLNLDIQGVHCAACVWLIEELFRQQPGGIQLRINPTLGKVELSWDPELGDLKAFLTEVDRFGYRLGPSRKGAHGQSRALLLRMAIAIAMALNVMMFSLSYYFGLAPEDGALYGFFGWLSLGMATVSLLAGGGVFLKGAVAGLRRRILHLDVPISLGMVLAWAGSTYGFLTGGPEQAYFDSLTVFIALMLIGRWAQEHILERNRNALLDSSGAENLTVKRTSEQGLEAISADQIVQGDELWIAPGDLLPVAAILMRKPCEVSLDWITGESDHVAFQPGGIIPAGAFNTSEQGFAATATEDFADSRLQDLLRSTTDSDQEYRPRWWHIISTWYVGLVLTVAAAGFLGWAWVDLTLALRVTISVLVVTCPCALGLATPLAEELTHFALRRSGIFLRKQHFLEKALSVRQILLDKTGTLTLGQLILSETARGELAALGDHERAVLRHMTARSNHPVSRSLAETLDRMPAENAAVTPVAGEDLTEIPGSGLELVWAGEVWRLGRQAFAAPADPALQLEPGQSTVFSRDGLRLASFTLGEDFKADAASEVATLAEAGYIVYLLSGDDPVKVAEAAKRLGLPADRAHGGLTPEAKAALVRRLDHKDTLMVGDGLNDSPSFAEALCAATPAVDRPVLPGKADFYFLGDGIAAIRRSLLAARQLRQVVRDNLILAVLYNVAAVGLCLAGLVTPVVAAVLMPLSSVSVVTLTAVRLSRRRLKWRG